ncbi:acyl-CoA-binding domain-containing protein 4 [Aulostomus maculatus]
MPVPAMAEPAVDHQKRFQAAVDVIQNLPKNGSYRPSYEVMLRFYSLYKQAVCGPCRAPRPGFWDPVGRYKWDAWSQLGEMSSEGAMAGYVDEMKRVAQEVIDTTPMNEKTASLFHHFAPLYLVIDDMPRPPPSLLLLTDGLKFPDRPAETKEQDQVEELEGPKEEASPPEGPEPVVEDLTTTPNDSGVCEGLVLTSDSETDVFCDSVEQLGNEKLPVIQSNGFQNGHESCKSPLLLQSHQLGVRRVGAGQGGEGGEDGQGPTRRSRDTGREGSSRNWRERGLPQGSPRWGAMGHAGGPLGRAEGAGQGGDGSEGGPERLQEAQLQQQIILALRRLREDMRSVMDRLEVVERLAATHVQRPEWRPCLQCAATQEQEERWWPFDLSPQTLVLFLLWPFAAQGLVYLLRKAQRRRLLPS